MANNVSTSQKAKREELRRELVRIVGARWPGSATHIDLVDDYLALWDDKCTLRKDIRRRGRKVTKLDSRGQKQLVNNDSIDQIIKINAQMLSLLKAMDLDPAYMQGEDDAL